MAVDEKINACTSTNNHNRIYCIGRKLEGAFVSKRHRVCRDSVNSLLTLFDMFFRESQTSRSMQMAVSDNYPNDEKSPQAIFKK
uniref:FHA domain-containing protein n=1 Tax=Heterorhabditis bacteriophora TaxID=37862 RepID=A0A1I7XPE9_HETBA